MSKTLIVSTTLESRFEQYASKVRAVSSFSLGGIGEYSVASHPMQALGPLNCMGGGEVPVENDCRTTFMDIDPSAPDYKTRNPPIGYISQVNLYSFGSPLFNENLTPLMVPAKVISITGTGINANITYEVLTPQKRVNGTMMVPCTMHRGNESINKQQVKYPEDCHENLVEEFPIIIENQPRRTMMDTFPRFWQPSESSFIGNVTIFGGDQSAMFGEEFRFEHNQIDTYNEKEDPKYTEFIEVEFDKKVYPVEIEIGTPQGGGNIVGVKALTPDGDWVKLYSNYAQLEKSRRVKKVSQYFYFDESICRQNFLTNVVRIELDTSKETGVNGATGIDYIMLRGSEDIQSAIMLHGEDQLLYIPDKDQHGSDSFEIQAWDCGGKQTRASKPGTIEVSILPSPDTPVIYPHDETVQVSRCNINSLEGGTTQTLTFISNDVDEDETFVTLVEEPAWGELRQNQAQLQQGTNLSVAFQQSKTINVFEINYTVTSACSSVDFAQNGFDKFKLQVTDSTGSSAIYTVDVQILKENKRIAGLSVTIAKMFFSINMLICLLSLLVVIIYRKHYIIKAAQVNFMILIVLGSFISTLTIPLLTIDDNEDGSNQRYADLACKVLPWVYTFGFITTFAPLYAKLLRTATVFDLNKSVVSSNARSSANKKKSNNSFASTLRSIAMFWICEFGIVGLMTVVAPLEYRRIPVRYSDMVPGFVVESIGECTSHSGLTYVFLASIVGFHIMVLSFVTYYCFKTIHINGAFSEAKHVRIAIFSSLQLLLFSIPVMIILGQNPDPETSLFVRSGVIFLNDSSALLFIVCPKIYYIAFGYPQAGVGTEFIDMASKRNSKVSPSGGATNMGTYNSTVNSTVSSTRRSSNS